MASVDSSRLPAQEYQLQVPRNANVNNNSYGPQKQEYLPPSPTRLNNNSTSSLGSVSSMSLQSNTSTPLSNNLTSNINSTSNTVKYTRPTSSTPSSPLGGTPRTSRKMTAGSSPLAFSSPLASTPSKIKPKANMPTTLPLESVCECFICHSASPYSQEAAPEIPANERQELSRLAPTCPSIHLYCLASRLPMSLPLDPAQKSPLTRSILDYFYSTWIDDSDRGPRIQCLNFIPIHPIPATCFDRYLEGQSWNKRLCRPLWHAADLRCKLGFEGMYRNCMQDKCASCFIFNDGFEDTIAKDKCVYLSPHSSRAHNHFIGSKPTGNVDDNKVMCMVLTFAALGRSYDVPPSKDKMKRPPKGWDVVHRQVEDVSEEYGVFAADALIPLAMVLYKVI
ncbi:hypothetical protein BGZ52_007797 [Haplosporangium bisporale]|nr:hypothetical protein BGZ52_007797 [Haplosporangium bisporale]KAF9212556.1 hypothetical protein BGZ59_006599 [Podila verticillata]KFH73948.1 hypothetical protein MVEG_01161 [Podila verticillata NRRL 6337]